MANVGSAFISIIPQMKGIKSAIGKEMQGAAASGKEAFGKAFQGAGSKIGKALGGEMSKAFAGQKLDTSSITAYRGAIKALEADVAKAAAAQAKAATQVTLAEQKLQSARTSRQAAAEKVALAEQKLAQEIEKHGKGSIQAQAAQVKLTQAMAGLEAQDAKVTAAEAALATAREKGKVASDSLTKSQEALKNAQSEAAKATQDAAKATEQAAGGMATALGGKFDQLKALAGDAGEKVKTGLSTAFNVMKENAVAAIGAVVAAGKGLYEIGEQFDDMSDTIRVGTGATGAALKGMEQNARNVAKTVPTSFADAGAAVADWNTRMGLTGKGLEKLAAQSETLKHLGLDADINQLSGAFTLWGKTSGEDAANGMDALFRVSQATGVGMNELAKGVQENGTALQQFGFSFENSAAMVGLLDKAGLESTKIMAAMSKSMVSLAKDGEQPKEAFNRVIGEIDGFLKAGNDAAAIDVAGKVFGTRGAAQMIGALKQSKLSMGDLMSQAGVTGDTIIGLGQETADAGEKWTMLKNRALDFLEPFGSAVFGGVADLLDKISAGFDKITSGGLGNLTGMLGGAMPVIGGLVGALGPLASQIPIIGGAFGGLTGPVGLAVGAFAGMVTNSQPLQQALMNLGQAFMPIIQLVIQLGGQLMSLLGPILGSLGNALAPIINAVTKVATTLTSMLVPIIQALMPLIAAILGAIAPLMDALTPLIEAVLNIINAALTPIVGIIQATLIPTISNIIPIITAVVQTITGVVTPIIAAITNSIKMFSLLLKGDFAGAWEAAKQVVANVWKAIQNAITGAINILITIVTSWLNNAKQIFTNIWNGISTTVLNVWKNIQTAISNTVRDIGNFLGNAWKTISSTVKSAWDGMLNLIKGAWVNITGAISNGINSAMNFVKALPGRILSGLGNLGMLLFNSGRSLIDGFINGIKAVAGKIKNTVSNVLGSVRKLFPFSPAKEGPFSGRGWVLYSGLSIGEGFAEGLDRSASDAVRSARSMASRTRAALRVIDGGMAVKPGAAGGAGGQPSVQHVTNIVQNIQTATVPSTSRLRSQAAAADNLWRRIA